VTKYLWLIFTGAALLAGCSADSYRYSADRQVQAIVRQREQQTLGYQPQVQASTTVQPAPSPAAYAKVPPTQLPPPTTSPIEALPQPHLPFEALGPRQLLPSGLVAPTEDAEADELLERGRVGLQYGPPIPGPQPIRLDLFASISYGVEHSREYRAQMEDLYLSALDVTLERHLFEPRPFAQTGVRFTGGQEDVSYRSALAITNSIGVRQQLPYGGEVTARALVNFVNTLNGNSTEGESASLVMSASIPLLRGAGMVNLEPLISSERAMVYAVREFENFRRAFAVEVASTYFQLLAQQQSITDRRQNLESRRALTQRSREMYIAGRLNYLEVQRALQEQLTAQNDLVDAEADYQQSLDNFKLLLGMQVEQPLNVVSHELDVNIPDFSTDEAANLAHAYRLDLQTAEDQIEDSRRRVNVAQNGLLPDLDLVAEGSVGTASNRPASHINNDTSVYSAGIELDIPIDRVSERNAYRRSLILLERSQRSYERLKDVVAIQARDALRSIFSARTTLDIQQRNIELARLRLDNANELLRSGRRTDTRDVVEAQNALLRAQDQFERARANLQIQVLQFLRDTGTLRVDPHSGSLGRSLDRKQLTQNAPQLGAILIEQKR
jgi:outer membrane protein TolC